MSRLLFWAATALFTILAASFAFSNREAVSLKLWPLPGEVDAPFYIVVLAIAVLGYLIGRLVSWWANGTLRSAHRQRGRELDRLQASTVAPAATGRQIQTT